MKKLRNQLGFTFIEVLMAAAILMVGTLVAMSMGDFTSQNLAFDQDRVTATQLGGNILEDLLNRYPTDPLLTAGAHSQQFDSLENPVGAGGFYTVNWTITANSPTPNILTIQLSVNWLVSGIPKAINFMTYRSSL